VIAYLKAVHRRKKPIIFVMLALFAVLSLKSFLPSLSNLPSNCDEFGHIHFHKINADTQKQTHAGQSAVGSPIIIAKEFIFPEPVFILKFEALFDLKNNFESPFLEPRRKPPRRA
jgi:hypothetical protein